MHRTIINEWLPGRVLVFMGCLLIRPLKGADGDPRILRVGNVLMCVAYLYLGSVLDAIVCDAHNTIDTECRSAFTLGLLPPSHELFV